MSCNTGGVGDYVRTGVNGIRLREKASPQEFADAIKQMLQNQDMYVKLCVSSFQEYTTRLNWPCSVGKLVELCRSLVSARSPA